MVKRYELTDAQWVRIEGLLLGKPGDPGCSGSDNRLYQRSWFRTHAPIFCFR